MSIRMGRTSHFKNLEKMQTDDNIKIAILTIATGKYKTFLDDLIDSSEKYFMEGIGKEYFIFSDSIGYRNKNTDRINVIEQKHLGWPYDTMMRFHMFLSIREKLLEFDYVFFLNANMIFNKNVGADVIPAVSDSYLVGVQHPGFYLKSNYDFPYERNKDITCSVEKNAGNFYFQGCFNGGRSQEWIEMCEVLADMLDADLSKNLIPIWHDESYLNWYFNEKKAKVLSPTYGVPEQVIDGDFNSWDTGYKNLQSLEHYIIQRDKRKYGGTKFLREIDEMDLSRTTFIIPVKIEHPDRYRNAKTVLNFMNRYLKTNVFIFEVSDTGESKLDFLNNLHNLNVRHWVSKYDGIFHRTRYLNIMLNEVETPVVVNYDIDVLLSPDNYLKSQEIILSGDAKVLYPYENGMGQYQVLDGFNYEGFFSSNFSYDFLNSGDNLREFSAECGHCIFFKTNTYRELGGENEHFVSYGPEDKERMLRFSRILGDKVKWSDGEKVYHFEHYRSSDSSPANPCFNRNWSIYDSISKMGRDEILGYYSSVEYRKNYSSFSTVNNLYEI